MSAPSPQYRRQRQQPSDDIFVHATVESLREKIDRNETMPKKKRMKASQEQLDILSESFLKDPKPSAAVRNELAERLGITPRTVQVTVELRPNQLAGGAPIPAFVAVAASPSMVTKISEQGAVPDNLFADLNAGNNGLALLPPNHLNEFVSDSDDDGASFTSSFYSQSSSVSTLGLSHIHISPRINAVAGNSVYGNATFTRSLPDLNSMKNKQKPRHTGSPYMNNYRSSSSIANALDIGDDNSDFSSLPSSPNPYRMRGARHLTPNLPFHRPMSPVTRMSLPPNAMPQTLANPSPIIQPKIRSQRRHSLHAEQLDGDLPPDVLMQLQNNYLALQQQQALISEQQQLHLLPISSTPALVTNDQAWMYSPAIFSQGNSPEINHLQYLSLYQQEQLSEGIPPLSMNGSFDLHPFVNPNHVSASPHVSPIPSFIPANDHTALENTAESGFDSTTNSATPFSVTDLMFGLNTSDATESLMPFGLNFPPPPSFDTTSMFAKPSPAMQEEFQKLINNVTP
ncbi:hypothetical protein BC829DRAFT_440255 [Chytridium lagenaria]|nr:hypothetical protein BC829DRAFT_440255 [Chytridium lagenaria]